MIEIVIWYKIKAEKKKVSILNFNFHSMQQQQQSTGGKTEIFVFV